MHRIIHPGAARAAAAMLLALTAANGVRADGLTYAGSECPEPPQFAHYLEKVWVPDAGCPDGSYCLTDSGAMPGAILAGWFCRSVGPCPTVLPALPWETIGLECSGNYTVEFGAVAEGDCETSPEVSGLLAQTLRVRDGGALGLFNGSIGVDVDIVIHSGELLLQGGTVFTPVIVLGGDGPAMLTINGTNTFGLGDIAFGHLDGAVHDVCFGDSTFGWTPQVLGGDDAQVRVHAGPGSSLFFDGLDCIGSGSTYSLSATQNAILACNADLFVSGASSAQLAFDGSAQITVNGGMDCGIGGAGGVPSVINVEDAADVLVLGTLALGPGWTVDIADQGVIDCDAWDVQDGASVHVGPGAAMVAFFDPTHVAAGGLLQLDGGTHIGQGIDLAGKLVVEGGSVVEGTLEAFGGEVEVKSGPAADMGDVFLLAFAALSGSPDAVTHMIDYQLDGTATYRPSVGPGAPGPGASGTRIICSGTAQLDGTLEVALEGSVSAGEQFVVIEAAAVTGAFATVADGWSVIYEPTQVILVADEDMTGGTTPGDVTGDGVVDIQDLLAVLAAWGDCDDPGSCPADLDGDGTVSIGDLLEVLGSWTV